MLWLYLEVSLSLVLLVIVGLFLRLYHNIDIFFFVMLGVGLFAFALLADFVIQRYYQSSRRRKGVKVPKSKIQQKVPPLAPLAPSVSHLSFIENSPIEIHQKPFYFVAKKPMLKAQSQVQILDELVAGLPKDFNRCLILGELKLNPRDGSLLEYLASGKPIDSLICHEIYQRIDLIPHLGNLSESNILTQKRFVGLINEWIAIYDCIICHFDESVIEELQALLARAKAEGATAPLPLSKNIRELNKQSLRF